MFKDKEISYQLDKIINNKLFVNKYRLSSFLAYVVNKKISGEENQIKSYSIGVDVFEREENFNTSLDPIVRIQAGRLRRNLELYYLQEGKDDNIKIEIPKGSYIPVFKENRDIQDSVTQKKGVSKSIRMLVLPFADNSNDKSMNFCAETLSEEINSALSNFISIETISHYSSHQIFQKKISISEIRELFDVDYLITGSVNQINELIVFKVSLTETHERIQIWTKTFEQKTDNTTKYDFIKSVIKKVTSFIASEYGLISREQWKSAAKKETTNKYSREAVYLYHQYQLNVSMEGLIESEKALQNAIAKDPKFAEGLATLAEVNLDYFSSIYENRLSHLELAKDYIDQAIQIDPLLQYAYFVKGFYLLMSKKLDGIQENFKHLVNLNPHEAYYVGGGGFWLSLSGNYSEGLDIIKKSTKLNPYYPSYFHHAFVLDYISKDEYGLANEEALKFYNPDFFWSHIDHAATFGLLGKTQEAEKSLSKLLETNPDFVNHPLEYTSVFVPQKNLLEQMMIGLKRAGLKMK